MPKSVGVYCVFERRPDVVIRGSSRRDHRRERRVTQLRHHWISIFSFGNYRGANYSTVDKKKKKKRFATFEFGDSVVTRSLRREHNIFVYDRVTLPPQNRFQTDLRHGGEPGRRNGSWRDATPAVCLRVQVSARPPLSRIRGEPDTTADETGRGLTTALQHACRACQWRR